MSAAERLTNDEIASKLEELPTLPAVVYELAKVINDPMSSTSDVEKIMAGDQSLTSKVLTLVNSAYYSIPGGVSSLGRAIAYIGFDTVNQLVLSATILKALEVKGPQSFDMNLFWKHSIGVGIAAETIAKRIQHPTPADLFTCGLVHDMGKVALFTVASETMLKVVQIAQDKQISYSDAEGLLEIPSHTVIGELLARRWNLPPPIQGAIRHHHSISLQERTGLKVSLHRNIDIVLLANLLVHALKFGNSGHAKIHGAPKEAMERLGLHPEQDLKPVLQDIKTNFEKATDFLRVLGGPE